MRVVQAEIGSHIGLKWSRNEDSVLQVPDVPLYAVADGTGGTEPAEIALGVLSERVTDIREQVRRVSDDPSAANRLAFGRLFEEIFAEASAAVRAKGDELGRHSFASTLLAVTVVDHFAFFAHVGSSRAYLLRGNELWRLTTDHTVATEQLRRGLIDAEEYSRSPFAHHLTRALGLSVRPQVEFGEVRLAEDDTILVCTDGLTDTVSEKRIAEQMVRRKLNEAIKSLVQASYRAGAPDNISLALLRIGGESTRSGGAGEVSQTLRDVFLFAALGEPERMAVAPYMDELIVEAGDTICVEGEPSDTFYVVIGGTIELFRGGQTIRELAAGQSFGELGLTRPGNRAEGARASTRARLFGLSRARFHEILRERPSLGAQVCLSLLRRVGDRLAEVSDRVAQIESALGR